MVVKRNHTNTKSNDRTVENEQDDAVIGRAFFVSLGVFIVVGLVALGAYTLLSPKPKEEKMVQTPLAIPADRVLPTVSAPLTTWTDITRSAGIDFQHFS